jgi:hypothetical protein
MSDAPEARPPAILVPPSKRGKRPRKPKAAASPEATLPPDDLTLSEKEVLKMRLHDAEFRQHSAEATARYLEKQALLRQLDPDNRLGLLDQAIGRSGEAAAKAKAAHAEVVKHIETRLGITLTDYSYDADTGRLWRQATAPTQEK